MSVNEITEQIIGAAIEVHRAMGPGLLESAYETCLCHELQLRGLSFVPQLVLPIRYKGIQLSGGYRIDLLVGDCVLVEIKAVESLQPIHEAQVLTYLRLGGWPVGLLINFNSVLLKQGIRRLVQNLPESSVPSASLR